MQNKTSEILSACVNEFITDESSLDSLTVKCEYALDKSFDFESTGTIAAEDKTYNYNIGITITEAAK